MAEQSSIPILAGLTLVSCIGASAPKANAQSVTKAANPWDRQVYFGEQHMHTRNSFDAFTVGVRQTWDEA